MFRFDIINHLIKINNFTNYLEIGVFDGECIRQINCQNMLIYKTINHNWDDWYIELYEENSCEKILVIKKSGISKISRIPIKLNHKLYLANLCAR